MPNGAPGAGVGCQPSRRVRRRVVGSRAAPLDDAVAAVWAWHKVYSPATVADREGDAYRDGHRAGKSAGMPAARR